jgi:hypothetical protein
MRLHLCANIQQFFKTQKSLGPMFDLLWGRFSDSVKKIPRSRLHLHVTLRLRHCRVDDDNPLVMRDRVRRFLNRNHVWVSS